MNETQTPENRKNIYNDRLVFYHPTQTGNGTAARLEFRLRRPEEERDSCFFLDLARQKSVGSRSGEGPRNATFDWMNRITVKIAFMDACELLTVLEGKTEQMRAGKGLYHDAGETNTIIQFRRHAEPAGFALEVSRKNKAEGAEVSKAHILLTEAEGIAMRCLLQQGVGLLAIANQASRLLYPPTPLPL